MKKYLLLATTLLFTSGLFAQEETHVLPKLPDCDIKEESCNDEYYLLFVEFKTIKSFFEKQIIPVETYLYYKKALESVSEEKLASYQERFIREQDSFFVEIPECDYKDVGCWEEFQGFFNIFQQTVLLCNENELDRDTCISYSKRIQEEFKLKMNEMNNN